MDATCKEASIHLPSAYPGRGCWGVYPRKHEVGYKPPHYLAIWRCQLVNCRSLDCRRELEHMEISHTTWGEHANCAHREQRWHRSNVPWGYEATLVLLHMRSRDTATDAETISLCSHSPQRESKTSKQAPVS